MTPVNVRPASAADASRLAALSDVLGYPVEPAEFAERLRRTLARKADAVFVAEGPKGEVIGWIHAAEQELLESGRRCEIVGLVVDAQHRGAGVGRMLVTAAEAWATGRGLSTIAVRSNIARSEAHPFYERLGYQRVKTQHAYRKRLQ